MRKTLLLLFGVYERWNPSSGALSMLQYTAAASETGPECPLPLLLPLGLLLYVIRGLQQWQNSKE